MEIRILNRMFIVAGMFLLALMSGNAAATIVTGDFYYTIRENSGHGLFRASYTYDQVTDSFSVSPGIKVQDSTLHTWNHIAINPQNPDLIIAGGTVDNTGPTVRVNINRHTGAASPLVSSVGRHGVRSLDLADDNTVLGAENYWISDKVTRFSIAADGSLGNPATLSVRGDETSVHDIITTPTGTYYLAFYGDPYSDFGTLTYDTGDVATATAVITNRMYGPGGSISNDGLRNVNVNRAMNTGEYDPFSNTLILAGGDTVMQIALDGTILSNLVITSPLGQYGENWAGIAVDGAGHVLITDDTDAVMLFIDYSSTGNLGDPSTIIRDATLSFTGFGRTFGIVFATFPDTDGDGIPDNQDPCPLDPENDADGDGYCGDVDICPLGDDGINTDGDRLPDACDVCPLDHENDADGDGVCESSSDCGLVADTCPLDNCPLDANPGQADNDMDGLGDVCDPDDDNDGYPDESDNCPLQANDQSDWDGDGAGDECDTDADGDGVLDLADACPNTPVDDVVNAAGCSISGLCPCEHPTGGDKWKNHGAYVSCVAHLAKEFREAGLITVPVEDNIVAIAGMSSCGHKNK